jgi:1-carboxybiuret hydrolase subunit AtzG-like protein
MPERPINVEDDLATYVLASAKMLGLKIPEENLLAVRENLQTSLRLANLVATFPVADEIEPAPVFEA